MKHDRYRVGIDVPGDIRRLLLESYPPQLPNVRARTITWAYDVPADYRFDQSRHRVQVLGLYRSPGVEAFKVRFNRMSRGSKSWPFQADQQSLLHITVAIADGVAAADARAELQAALQDRKRLEDVYLPGTHYVPSWYGRLQMFPLWDTSRIGTGHAA